MILQAIASLSSLDKPLQKQAKRPNQSAAAARAKPVKSTTSSAGVKSGALKKPASKRTDSRGPKQPANRQRKRDWVREFAPSPAAAENVSNASGAPVTGVAHVTVSEKQQIMSELFGEDMSSDEKPAPAVIEHDSGIIKILLQPLKGDTLTTRVLSTDKISAVKAQIQQQEGFAEEHQKLIFGGKLLENGQSVNECGIVQGSLIRLVVRAPVAELNGASNQKAGVTPLARADNAEQKKQAAAKQKQEEAAAKRAREKHAAQTAEIEREAAKKKADEAAAAKKRADEAAAAKKADEAAVKNKAEEAAAAKKAEETSAAKKAEEAAAKNAEETVAAKKAEEAAAAKKRAEAAAAKKKASDEAKCEIQIRLKTLASVGDKTHTVRVLSTDTISQLKDKVEQQEGYPAAEQRLVFIGKQLDNGKTVDGYSIKEGSVLHVVVRKTEAQKAAVKKKEAAAKKAESAAAATKRADEAAAAKKAEAVAATAAAVRNAEAAAAAKTAAAATKKADEAAAAKKAEAAAAAKTAEAATKKADEAAAKKKAEAAAAKKTEAATKKAEEATAAAKKAAAAKKVETTAKRVEDTVAAQWAGDEATAKQSEQQAQSGSLASVQGRAHSLVPDRSTVAAPRHLGTPRQACAYALAAGGAASWHRAAPWAPYAGNQRPASRSASDPHFPEDSFVSADACTFSAP